MSYDFDIEEIKSQVIKVLHESQYDYPCNVDGIINDWLKAKRHFINLMDGKLIYQSKELVSFELSDKMKKDRLLEFADLIIYHYNNAVLGDFIYTLEVDDFYHNLTSQKYKIYTPDNKEIEIPKNIKVLKAIKFFVPDEAILKEIQNDASRIIQEDIIKGYLCFSVHPLDFLSASENVHNWRSCHALDGEYRSGNLNYLMDDSTVICYLKAEKQAILPHFPEDLPWNSKKWRLWLFFSNDQTMMFAGRQYPFSSSTGLDYIRTEILPKVRLGKWTQFYQNKVTEIVDPITQQTFTISPSVPVGRELKPMRKLITEGDSNNAYNDLLYSSCYDPLYSFRKSYGDPDDREALWIELWGKATGLTENSTTFIIGKACKCPLCNKNIIENSAIMACYSCIREYGLDEEDEDYGICDNCGTTVRAEELTYLEYSDVYVCSDCVDEATTTCRYCGTRDFKTRITIFKGIPLCPDCKQIEEEKPSVIILDSLKVANADEEEGF